MIEGLWTINFSGKLIGAGAIVLLPTSHTLVTDETTGRILGGDATYFYVGSFKLDGTTFTATLTAKNFVPGAPNILGRVGDLQYEARGTVNNDVITGTASVAGIPTTVNFVLVKREPLATAATATV